MLVAVVAVLFLSRHRWMETTWPWNALRQQWEYLPLVLALSVAGLFLEAMAWRSFISNLETLSPQKAFRRQWGALTWSFITPNNLGEYYARMAETDRFEPLRGPYTLAYNLLKLFLKSAVGCVALLLLAQNSCGLALSNALFLGTVALCLGIPAAQGVLRAKGFLPSVPATLQLKTLGWMALRYGTLLVQFAFCLQWVAPEVSFASAMALGVVYLLVISVLPTFGPLDGFIKAGMALLLACAGGVQPGEAAIASVVLWTANWALPALVGWKWAPLQPIRQKGKQ